MQMRTFLREANSRSNRRKMMTRSPILKGTFYLSLCLQSGLSAWGQQSDSVAPASKSGSVQPARDSTQAPRFEFDRSPEQVTFRNEDVQLKGVLVKPMALARFQRSCLS